MQRSEMTEGHGEEPLENSDLEWRTEDRRLLNVSVNNDLVVESKEEMDVGITDGESWKMIDFILVNGRSESSGSVCQSLFKPDNASYHKLAGVKLTLKTSQNEPLGKDSTYKDTKRKWLDCSTVPHSANNGVR